MKILDATAGARSIWYEKNHPDVVFFDQRCGKFRRLTKENGCRFKNDRVYKVYPDIIGKWEHIPFKDESFEMVVFDPPHLFKNKGAKIPNMASAYGLFYNETWRGTLQKGIDELFRVLKPNGFLVLKWCEIDKSLDEILSLFPYRPLFGSHVGHRNNTHWICFSKNRQNKEISEFFSEAS